MKGKRVIAGILLVGILATALAGCKNTDENKKETGKSFVGYLTGYRMEKAARMLVETNEKSYMIAKSVGYTDPNYFSYVFKRQYGVSPSKYRTEYENI